jgi:hypothetical protein
MIRHINAPSLCREKPLTPFLTFGTWPQEGRSAFAVGLLNVRLQGLDFPLFILPRVDAGEERGGGLNNLNDWNVWNDLNA